MASAEPVSTYTEEQMASDDVSKKDIVTFLQENGREKFLRDNKVFGKVASIAKGSKKDHLISVYKKMFETKAFKGTEGEGDAVEEMTAKAAAVTVTEEAPAAAPEKIRYTKQTTKKGSTTKVRKGDLVGCNYTGTLEDGTVFDTNIATSKKKKKDAGPLKFRVGQGRVIRGWDEALQTMTVGEKAKITIEPEWAYGRKGLDGKIPPNSTLIFEVEVVSAE
ncbi:peptidyl-prolyl cis-trans isomerase FKBP3-like [Sycon ciliatum]|uniref:peptidyl-prolyl cis-trans isomerase FKBP3-like n=1 Tax=Sycon ciliatum TaxID=27933 RepID=UPI0020AE4687|eukprot:scpid6099/ scgid15982/ Peptidyl-prolyl cis-trans isomerase FKBP3; 25 kDa FK506-binding protein; FK506-binding protein 3; Immunophilin FKBP25; Rapamycin-selective 25 kDa immunophilin; Rotamase